MHLCVFCRLFSIDTKLLDTLQSNTEHFKASYSTMHVIHFTNDSIGIGM